MADDGGHGGVRREDEHDAEVRRVFDAEESEWAGTKVISGDLGDEVRKLKKQPGHDLLLAGSGQLFNALMEMNLIDLYRFMVHPVVLGQGKRLFAQGTDQIPLNLTDTKRFASGIVILEFESAKS